MSLPRKGTLDMLDTLIIAAVGVLTVWYTVQVLRDAVRGGSSSRGQADEENNL